jgi:squalene-hopene/tetraprenyl-beta-curcumene cyclase
LSEQAGVESILAALFLGSSEAFDRMWSLQSDSGAWAWNSLDLDPWETPDSAYFGAALASLAVKAAPEAHRNRPEARRLAGYLRRGFASQPLHNRLMAIWAGAVPGTQTASTLEELWRRQSADGGWTLEAVGPWGKHEKAPPAAGTSAYATAFAAAALRQAGVSDPRLARALDWLKSRQHADGYWEAVSMNKTYPEGSMMARFMRDAATAYAALALAE